VTVKVVSSPVLGPLVSFAVTAWHVPVPRAQLLRSTAVIRARSERTFCSAAECFSFPEGQRRTSPTTVAIVNATSAPNIALTTGERLKPSRGTHPILLCGSDGQAWH
jgi:hypothetical protein